MKKYLKLFFTTLYISAFTFGGGYVIVSLMKKKFSDELHWIDDDEMLDLVAIAQSSPGAVAVNASLLVGKKIGGIVGALVAIIATIIPPFVIMTVISHFYQAFAANEFVAIALKAMQAGVLIVIADVVITLSMKIIAEKRIFPIVMIFLAFVATYFLKINLIYIILVCGFIGGISEYVHKKVVVAEKVIDSQEEIIDNQESHIEELEEKIQSLENELDQVETTDNENNGGKN